MVGASVAVSKLCIVKVDAPVVLLVRLPGPDGVLLGRTQVLFS
jgi:hypothetical protein